MTERHKEAIILVYTNACVDLSNKFKSKEDYTVEMALCDAIENKYPDIIAELQQKDSNFLESA
jgi:hypothetical protein